MVLCAWHSIPGWGLGFRVSNYEKLRKVLGYIVSALSILVRKW